MKVIGIVSMSSRMRACRGAAYGVRGHAQMANAIAAKLKNALYAVSAARRNFISQLLRMEWRMPYISSNEKAIGENGCMAPEKPAGINAETVILAANGGDDAEYCWLVHACCGAADVKVKCHHYSGEMP